MSRKWIVAILVYIGLIALCCIVVYAVPSVRGMLEKTYIAQNGTIDVKDEVSGFIVRDEVVYAAGQKSMIQRLEEPGALIKARTKVVNLTPTEVDLEETEGDETAGDSILSKAAEDALNKATGAGKKKDDKAKEEEKAKEAEAAEGEGEAEEEEEPADHAGRYKSIMEELGDSVKVTESGATADAGYVCYFVDGAEAKLSTSNLDSLTEKDLKSFAGRKTVKTPDNHCSKGQPVYKIVRNSKWYLVFFVDNEALGRFIDGDTVTIDINGEPVSVGVNLVESGTKTTKVALSCKAFFDGFLEEREMTTTVTFVSATGLVLEDASIVTAPDGMRGVFVKNKLGEHVFKPVSAKADDGKKCVVYSDIYVDAEGNFVETIRTYDEIVAEPTEEDIESLNESHPAKKKP